MKTQTLHGIRSLLLMLPAFGLAQTDSISPATSPSIINVAVPSGERLGRWITQNRPELSQSHYLLGTMWLSSGSIAQQTQEKKQILKDLEHLANKLPVPDAGQLLTLKQMLANLPVTGRKKMVLQDPWLMQANPSLEPIAQNGDIFVFNNRPGQVRVIAVDSNTCHVEHQAQRYSADYLKACAITSDAVWLIQPDGTEALYGTGVWNADEQNFPAPGATIWVHSPHISNELGQRIANFLATQAIAQDKLASEDLPPSHGATPYKLATTANNWGVVGLLQTPTARTSGAGMVGLTTNRAWPYTRTTLLINPFDELELAVRYTDISNRLYGPIIAGDQSYKDKSLEIKWRLRDETAHFPALAIGLRDPIGTGFFGGEYLVASKRWGNFDTSLGLGWGYLGATGNQGNPFSIFGKRFESRQVNNVGTAGRANTISMFTGSTAFFGGVQWQTPIPKLTLKLEVDGNNYQNEPMGNRFKQSSNRLNYGLSWQRGPLTLQAGLERGNQLTFGFTLNTDFSSLSQPKRAEASSWPLRKPLSAQTVQSLTRDIPSTTPEQLVQQALTQQTGWHVSHIQQEKDAWVIEFDNTQTFSLPERLDRGMRVVHQLAPDNIKTVRFLLKQYGVPIHMRLIDRTQWAAPRTSWTGQHPTYTSEGTPAPLPATETAYQKSKSSAGLGLGYQQQIGGPDGYLYSLNANLTGSINAWKGSWVDGFVKLRLLDNFENFHYTAPSNLPRVRTLLREYQTAQRLTLPNLQINQFNRWSDSVYTLAYVGALESMYAGAGAELLWRPLGSAWSVGADINKLAQRDFDQWFKLRDYRVTSGHITAYWDTGWQGVQAKARVGQYLAGDKGATLEITRHFGNGASMGIWATKTNVSSSAFGEGSFDKGVFISIPFDAMLSAWSNSRAELIWQPLIRDGGARLNKAQNLWEITRSRDPRQW